MWDRTRRKEKWLQIEHNLKIKMSQNNEVLIKTKDVVICSLNGRLLKKNGLFSDIDQISFLTPSLLWNHRLTLHQVAVSESLIRWKWKLVKYISNKHKTIHIHISLFAPVCTPPQSDRSPAFFYFYQNFLSREILMASFPAEHWSCLFR